MKTIDVADVSKSFSKAGNSIPILKNLNFSANSGEKVAILGPSGSGKSTLLSIMAGLEPVDTGAVTILDQHLAKLNESEITHFRGQKLGIIFQQFHLVKGLNALQNVLLPLEINDVPDRENIALSILERVGLKDRATHTPAQLSGGECQRVAIARAMAVKPPLIFADEPSGNLDEHTGEKVMNYLFQLVEEENTTLVLVTHNKELSTHCDRTLMLKEGSLHEA